MITRPTALVSSTRWSSYLRHAIEMGAQAAGIGLHKVKWSHTVIYGHATISMLFGMISYCAMLTGEDLSRYLNNIESARLRKA